jgi:uncharacterized protein YndB with AHSA1/START domain
MTNPDYVYTTYIRSTPEKVWAAITVPEFTRQYWGHENVSDWKRGVKWSHVRTDAERTVDIVGEVVEATPPKRLVTTWARPSDPKNPERTSRVTYEIEQIADMVRLTVTHSEFKADEAMAKSVAGGWPVVLGSLKSFLETGKGLDLNALFKR